MTIKFLTKFSDAHCTPRSPLLASLPAFLRRTPCSLPGKRCLKRQGKRVVFAVKIKLLLVSKGTSVLVWSSLIMIWILDSVHSWFIPTATTAFDQLPQHRLPCLHRGGVYAISTCCVRPHRRWPSVGKDGFGQCKISSK